jgi:phosphoribosylformylglycinamidine cyclo-ligase
MTYAGSGVDYNSLDPFKREAMRVAVTTKQNMEALGFRELEWSRGESAYLFQHVDSGLILAFVIEGLGTANRVAEDEALRAVLKTTGYASNAITNAAMSFNDMTTVGALPIVFALHPAVEAGSHLVGANGTDLIAGTKTAVMEAGCTYGPGETPGLRNIIVPGTMCLSGAAVGTVRKKEHLMDSRNVRAGLQMVFLASNGMHGNGYTMARKVAEKLSPDGYLTDIGDGILYGQELLRPTTIYVEFTRRCQDAGIPLVYAVNITGHGFRKLMRASQPLTYVVKKPPEIPRLFQFIMETGPVDIEEMFKTFNMGAGYAVFVEPAQVDPVIAVSQSLGIAAWDAGPIEEGPRQVVIEQYGLTFNELSLR